MGIEGLESFQLVIGIEERNSSRSIIKYFIRSEESSDLDQCILYGIGCVHDICLTAHAEVTSESSRGGVAPVGGAGHCAENIHYIHPLEAHYDHRRSRH